MHWPGWLETDVAHCEKNGALVGPIPNVTLRLECSYMVGGGGGGRGAVAPTNASDRSEVPRHTFRGGSGKGGMMMMMMMMMMMSS